MSEREGAGRPVRASNEPERQAATGVPGEPALWVRAVDGAEPDIARRPFLYRDSRYAPAPPPGEAVRARQDPGRRVPDAPAEPVNGPVLQKPVWTWEIPAYFWLGGVAAGSSFVGFACDLSGDEDTARVARRVAIGAVLPCPPLLISDLGRPGRFHHMLRVFKPRSPMNLGAWALTVFGALGSAAAAADAVGRPRAARAAGALNALVGCYVGSYAGVLLSTTAVPLWARSRLFLGPIFVSTAVANGAGAVRLALRGREAAATRDALARIEAGAVASELLLTGINERRLGDVGGPLREGTSGGLLKAAKWSARLGLATRALPGESARRAASALFLAGGLALRFGWVEAGKRSAQNDEVVARDARRP